MLRIKQIRFVNYCGYKDTTFSFFRNGKWIPMAVFFGPNGCGKSTCLNAIRFLLSAKEYKGRDLDLVLRSLVYNQEYNPDIAAFCVPDEEMQLEGIFDENGKEKIISLKAKYWEETIEGQSEQDRPSQSDYPLDYGKIVNIKNDGDIEQSHIHRWIITFFKGGFERNDLEDREKKSVLFVDADNMMNMNKFQVPESRIDKFINLAESVYGYKCGVGARVMSGSGDKEMGFYSDLILEKGQGKTKVHFKRMSAGEKKIATMLRTLCNPNEIDEPNIILIDNIEMHIYMKRHGRLVEKLIEHFPDKQFIVTTHSGTLIQHVMERNADKNEPSWLFDIERYKPEEAMNL